MALSEFLKSLGDICYTLNEPLDRHTTFKIGGAADVFVSVRSVDELGIVLKSAKIYAVPVFIIGKGSNLLVSDNGIEGAVVSLAGLDGIEVSGNSITCGAGANLSALCIRARDEGLSGLEFAFGIPGSVGGALYMNAGAYGGEMSQAVRNALCMDADGNLITLSLEEMELGYRTSAFKKRGLIILSATFELNADKGEEINGRMQELLSRRKDKQPLEYPSAGSTFKRPEGHFAGALIEKNGLKGAGVGAAQVSEKHAGFVINTGDATCADVLALIEKIQKTVFNADGVRLETEVIFVGRVMN